MLRTAMRHFFFAAQFAVLLACASTPTTASDASSMPKPAEAIAGDSTRWEADIAAFEQADSVVRRRPGGVVFVGSSSIRLWDSLAGDFPGVAILNRGFGGSRVRDSTFHAQRIITPYQPRAVVLYAGDNDLAEGRTPQQVRDDFVAFVAKVRQSLPQARIAYIAIKPSPSRQSLLPQARTANQLIRDYATQASGIDYLDVFTPMLDAHGAPRADLFLADRLHMNANGYALWAQVVGPWLDGL
ncbi:SGNH/GDSL hydrolase family protein [Lysobacter cavernae]|uniref:SGNH/GDSL hydrolase family protein n=1 Tax=Lysobacter cavernae TaxID=1685901 RepID=A0ABV7RK33_9GAMM